MPRSKPFTPRRVLQRIAIGWMATPMNPVQRLIVGGMLRTGLLSPLAVVIALLHAQRIEPDSEHAFFNDSYSSGFYTIKV